MWTLRWEQRETDKMMPWMSLASMRLTLLSVQSSSSSSSSTHRRGLVAMTSMLKTPLRQLQPRRLRHQRPGSTDRLVPRAGSAGELHVLA
jgi:hypothetical protein